jgi:hypothetical protein
MKKNIFLFIFLLSLQNIFSQTFTEKKIAEFPDLKNLDIYSFKTEPFTGAYIYGAYDTSLQKYIIYTKKGKSEPYNYFNSWQSVFDKEGNSYSISFNNITDTTYTYYLLKNSEPAGTFEYINDGWVERNGVIFFICRENGKNLIATYDMSSGKIERGKPYDEIIPCYMKVTGGMEGEPYGELGFTDDGKLFYLAVSGDAKFLVVGDAEQKHYSDIEMYSFTRDKKGVFTYIARDKGRFYEEAGNTFVVQGDKEFKKYPYIYGPIVFDAGNNPIYIAADTGSIMYPQRIVSGDTEGKVYTGGIYDIKFTPSGKLAYIGYNVKNIDKGTYDYFIVIDSKEGKKYSNIYNLSFPAGDEPYYVGFKGEECYIVRGNKSDEYSYEGVYEYNITPTGKTAFLGVDYGDYEKKIKDKYFVHVGDDRLGPYDVVTVSDYMTGRYIVTDNSDNYAFITQKVKNPVDYIYSYRVITNKGKNDEHEYVDYLNLYNGKPLYIAYDNYDAASGKAEYKIYFDNKPVGVSYDGINEFKFDGNTGIASFYTTKNNGFYLVEMKF